MSLYHRQPRESVSRTQRALIVDSGAPEPKTKTNPDFKPSVQAKKSFRVFAMVLAGMIGIATISVKVLEHLWSRRDNAISQVVKSHQKQDAPAVLSPAVPTLVPELPSREVTVEPSSAVAPSDRENVDTVYRWGKVLEEAGEWEGALKRYEEALAIDPANVLVLSRAGRLSIQRSRYTQASDYLARAHAADSANADIMNDLGVALTFAGRPTEAVALYQELLTRHPDYSAALFNKGYALVQLKETVEARTALETYLQAKPDDAMALGVLAILELGEKNHDQALALLDRAIAASPSWSTPYLDAAAICAGIGQNDRAINYLNRALEVASPSEVYQHYSGPAFNDLRTQPEALVLEKKIADLARKQLQ